MDTPDNSTMDTRPKPGTTSPVRVPDSLLKSVDEWASRQREYLTRSEAIRRLVELGLKGKR